MTTILITAPFDGAQLDRLREIATVVYRPWTPLGRPHSEEELGAMLAETGANVLVVELDPVGAHTIANASLEIIGGCRARLVNIDVEAAQAAGIVVLHTPGRNAHAVAEYVVAMMVVLMRNIVPSTDFVLGDAWQQGDRPYLRFRGDELGGRTVVFHGYGAVPRVVTELLRPYRCRLIAVDPFVDPSSLPAGVEAMTAEEAYPIADVLSVHLPVARATERLIDARLLSLLPTSARVINSARAAVMDYDALADALSTGRIAGAALDVLRDEPLGERDRALVSLPNVVVTPHIAGASHQVEQHHSRLMADALIAAIRDEPLPAGARVE
ncbi:NAD(P)-dependent oxidoreductase [Homoserinibacter sp. GY 40078]|uniref:NAD(P)-dependent oxidoreductase n=1 Tax=Homoserinibacter sp. GY 40078 TaxID=2603275 RepID=UPI0011C74C22|nr:NAD(P)-dependent oxidoreductase [Homoserinibacter sp. GY 40078]TXK19252.1 hydroxyacid dehydrogenase [Homoserinibacter sp. GY 40078]